MSGNTDQTKGKVKEAFGVLTGDKDLQRDGRTDQVAGKLKNKLKDATDRIKSMIDGFRDKH